MQYSVNFEPMLRGHTSRSKSLIAQNQCKSGQLTQKDKKSKRKKGKTDEKGVQYCDGFCVYYIMYVCMYYVLCIMYYVHVLHYETLIDAVTLQQ